MTKKTLLTIITPSKQYEKSYEEKSKLQLISREGPAVKGFVALQLKTTSERPQSGTVTPLSSVLCMKDGRVSEPSFYAAVRERRPDMPAATRVEPRIRQIRPS